MSLALNPTPGSGDVMVGLVGIGNALGRFFCACVRAVDLSAVSAGCCVFDSYPKHMFCLFVCARVLISPRAARIGVMLVRIRAARRYFSDRFADRVSRPVMLAVRACVRHTCRKSRYSLFF